MKVSKESMDEDHDHDYPGYMVMVVVVVHGWLASAPVLRNRRVACWCWCWCWPGEAAPRKPGTGCWCWVAARAEEEFLVVLFLYPLSDATRHQRQAGARQGMSFRQMCAGVHLLWIC